MLYFSFLIFVIIYKIIGIDLIGKLLKTPLIFPLLFIFFTFLISPILYYFDFSFFKLWLENYNVHFFTLNYKVLFIYVLFLMSMIVGLKLKTFSKLTLPKIFISYQSAGISGLISIIVLFYMLGGNIFGDVFNRETAVGFINEPGFGRFLLFLPILTFSLPLFLKAFKNLPRYQYVFLTGVFYLILVPFFGITSGRGTLVFPLLLIIFVNFDVIKKSSFIKISFFLIIFSVMMISLAGIRLGDSFSDSLGNNTLYLVSLSDAFSRFDSTYAGLSTFICEDWSFLYGRSYFYGFFQIFPPSMIDFRDKTITSFLAKAIHNDMSFDIPSGIASSIIFESYVNFGYIGTLISGILLGMYFRLSYLMYLSTSIEYKILAFHLAWLNPFGLSFALFFYDVFYKIFIPITFLLFVQYFLTRCK